jgi:ankyrin repeat protein
MQSTLIDPIWARAEHAIETGDADALDAILREHGDLLRRGPVQSSWHGGLSPDYSKGDARAILLNEHRFENWDDFTAFTEALKDRQSPISQFERAVDAIADGDIATLEHLLHDNPDLIRAQSTRYHHSTLLNYVGANGVESFRQRTPKNAVDVARVLLDAGADIDETADVYGGGCTTLCLIATSIHPANAGVQNDLIALFLDRGATVRARLDVTTARAAWSELINYSHANGRDDAALFLASRAPAGALDLEAAAGTGHLDVVKTFFTPETHANTRDDGFAKQLIDGFAWACEFGRTEVVEFLLEHGVDVKTKLRHHGQTGLHWAAYGAHADTVRVLLRYRPPVDAIDDQFKGTPLGWALYGWGGGGPQSADRRGYYDVVKQIVDAGGTADPDWLENPPGLTKKIEDDAEMRAAVGNAIKRLA